MGPAAQFDRIVPSFTTPTPHGEHANLVAVFFAEQGKCPSGDGIVGCHQPRADLLVGADFLIHLCFDRRDVLVGKRLEMREIEAEAVVRHQRALLRHVPAKPVAQRSVDKVRRRMVRTNSVSPVRIDVEMHGVAHLDRTFDDLASVSMQPPERLVGRLDGELQPLGRPDASGIARLTAAFSVERRLIGQHDDRIALPGRLHFGAVLDDGDNLGLARGRAVAGEFRRTFTLRDIEPDFLTGRFARALPRGTRGSLLLRHGGVEAVLVHSDTLRAQRVFGQVIGKAVSVVELEHGFARQRIALAQSGRSLVE